MTSPPHDMDEEEHEQVKLACGGRAVCELGWERQEQQKRRELSQRAKP